MINNTTTNTNTTTSPDHINVFAISFVVGIGVLSIISIILLTYYLYSRKPTSRRETGSVSSTDDQDSITIEVGLDEATLNTYPTILFAEAKIDKENPEEMSSSCSICLQEYKDSDMVRLLPDCDHLFHVQCIDPWLKLHRTCPVCRNSPVQSPLETLTHQRLHYNTWFVQIMRN